MNASLQYLLEVNALVVIVFGIYFLAFRNTTFHQYNRLYLLGGVMLSFLMPLLPLSMGEQNVLYAYTLPTISVDSSRFLVVAGNPVQPSQVLLNLYLFIASLMLLRLLRSFYVLFRSWYKKDFVFIGNTKLIRSNTDQAYSFFNRIVLPDGLKRNSAEFDMVFEHEKVHSRQLHSADIIALELAKVVLWINPIIYLLKNELARQHEYFVDRFLVCEEMDVERYGSLLIAQTIKTSHFSLVNTFNNSLVKNRIIMMTKSPNRNLSIAKYVLVVPLTFALLLIVSCTQDPIFLAEQEKGDTDQDKFSTIIDKNMAKNEGASSSPSFTFRDGREFEYPDEFPMYKGGKEAMMKFIGSNIEYPAVARANKLEGKVCVEFVVEPDGSISNSVIESDIGGGCGEEALRVVELMSLWQPGVKNGKTIPVKYKLPIMFKLE